MFLEVNFKYNSRAILVSLTGNKSRIQVQD